MTELELSQLRGEYTCNTRVLTREEVAERFLVANTNTKGCLDAPKGS